MMCHQNSYQKVQDKVSINAHDSLFLNRKLCNNTDFSQFYNLRPEGQKTEVKVCK